MESSLSTSTVRRRSTSYFIRHLWIGILLICNTHFAEETDVGPFSEPWLVGPLLAPFGYVAGRGHVDLETYVYSNSIYGRYNQHWHEHSASNFYNLNTQPMLWYGFANNWDIEIAPSFSWNHTHGASHWVVNDIFFELEYQVLYEKKGSARPAIKLGFLGTIPTGKYQKLSQKAKGTDIGGFGSWNPGIELALQKRHHISGIHYLIMHYAIDYVIPTAVHVKGFNTYGGGHHTKGKVYPGPYLIATVSSEYNFTQNWGIACDLQYLHIAHTRFSGRKGETDGKPNSIGSPSQEQFSLAPALEYSWSGNFGIVGGVWFSFAGRNANAFASGIIAINIYK